MNLQQIQEYIEENGISEKTNRHEVCYQRYYLCHYMRSRRVVDTLKEIANLVGYKEHDRVLHAIKRHKELDGQKVYKDYTLKLRTALKGKLPRLDLKAEVTACETLIDLHRIQKQIKEGLL